MRNTAAFKPVPAAWVLVLALLIGRPDGSHAANDPPVFNIDGIGGVDFCDMALFATDWQGGTGTNPRSDFNCDGVVNLVDLQDFALHACSDPPAAVQGTATVGVYFDALGTQTAALGLPLFAPIELYIVAHNVPSDIGGFSFGLEFDPGLLPLGADFLTPAALELPLCGGVPANVEAIVVGGEDLCLAQGSTVLLGQFSAFALAHGASVGIVPLNDGLAPSEKPSYVSCGGTCDWTYFAPAPGGRAVVNPPDLNGNGIADVYEINSTRIFQIVGTSTGAAWSMAVRGIAPAVFSLAAPDHPGLPLGAPASDFADAIIATLQGIGLEADREPWMVPSQFYVRVPGEDGFELGVGPSPEEPNCWIPTDPQCSFNPSIEEIGAYTSTEPIGQPKSSGLANHPNPFNPRTLISFELPNPGPATLAIYDSAGRRVRTLFDGSALGVGYHEVSWDGRDNAGKAMPAGVYHYRLTASGVSESRRMVLLK